MEIFMECRFCWVFWVGLLFFGGWVFLLFWMWVGGFGCLILRYFGLLWVCWFFLKKRSGVSHGCVRALFVFHVLLAYSGSFYVAVGERCVSVLFGGLWYFVAMFGCVWWLGCSVC